MKLSKKQYLIFKKIIEAQRISNQELAAHFKSSSTTISKNLLPLKEFDLIKKEAKKFCLTTNKFALILAQFLFENPGSEDLLYGEGLEIISELKNPKTIVELAKDLEISKISAYRHTNTFLKRGLLSKEKTKYELNEKVWPDLKVLSEEAEFHQVKLNKNIPGNSKIYYYSKNRIIFSTSRLVEACLTSFSKYSSLGISIFEQENFYRLPIAKLGITDIFLDSLECAKSIRRILLCTLFFLKHKSELNKIDHSFLEKIKKVLSGEKIEGFPSFEEIKEKAEMYDIKI
ncbi:hypothetical protein HZA97_05750 [Candidatus Woesearchaeota archaeon]|nr:hypothetical protein [Candidatus Woesearchaeota archaeon]